MAYITETKTDVYRMGLESTVRRIIRNSTLAALVGAAYDDMDRHHSRKKL